MSSPVLYKSRCFDQLPRLLLWSLSLYSDSQEQGRWRIYVPLLCKCPLRRLTTFQRLQWIFKICRECKVALCNYSMPKKHCWARACLGFPKQCHHCRRVLNLRKEVGKALWACWQPEEEVQSIGVLPRTNPDCQTASLPLNFTLQLCLWSHIPLNAWGIYLYIINNYKYMIMKLYFI